MYLTLDTVLVFNGNFNYNSAISLHSIYTGAETDRPGKPLTSIKSIEKFDLTKFSSSTPHQRLQSNS